MILYDLYYFSLGTQVLISLLLATWLFVKAGTQPGMRALAAFCLGMSAWSLGQLLINLAGDAAAALGKAMVNLGPLNCAFFLHFCVRFLGRQKKLELPFWYLASTAMVAWIALVDLGSLVPWLGFQRFYVFSKLGWIPGVYVVALTTWSHLLLVLGLRTADAKRRRQTMAILAAGVWGSFSTLMFLDATFHIPVFPYSVMFLPGYAVLLVYGILRYDMMQVNEWANRLLAWAVLMLIAFVSASVMIGTAAHFGSSQLSGIPLWQAWALSALVMAVVYALEGPTRRAIESLIFPGSKLNAALLEAWRNRLETAVDWSSLAAEAGTLLQAHLRQTVLIDLPARSTNPTSSVPLVSCWRDESTQRWRCDLVGWDGATPGVRRVGEVFADMLASAAARLDRLLQFADHEKRRLHESHLLELGGLSAAVAHELRNPLNIICMAAANCDAVVRADIREQILRADHLIQDLLSYSGEVRLNRQRHNLADLLRSVVATHLTVPITLSVPDPIWANVDAYRFEQVLHNLLNNAEAMLRGHASPRILVRAAQAGANWSIQVADNGPGVPEDLQPSLFQPFSTRRPGGTGLGLAIARRLVEAHGGKIELVDEPEWASCFQITLPDSGDATA